MGNDGNSRISALTADKLLTIHNNLDGEKNGIGGITN